MALHTLSVSECLRTGWVKFTARPWFYVGTFLVTAIVQFLLATFQHDVPGLISFLVSVAGSTFLSIGMFTVYLKGYDDPHAPRFMDLWNPKPFLRYLGASLLVALIVVAGLILFIVPGIIAMIAFTFACLLTVDRDLTPVQALKESYRITKGNWFTLFLFGLIVLLLGIVGMLPLFLGLLVVAPVAMFGSIHAYRTLSRAVDTTEHTA